MTTLTADTKIRLSQIKEFKTICQDKHSGAHLGDIRRWADGKLHEKTAHGWRVLPNGQQYELKTYKEEKLQDELQPKVTSPEKYLKFVDALFKRDYKEMPNTIHFPNITRKLAKQLGITERTEFILKPQYKHINPVRKAAEGQELTKEEYLQIPNAIRYADHAYLDTENKNFFLTFPDKKNPEKMNKLVFNKTASGNYMVTLGKVNKKEGINKQKVRLIK